MYGKAFEVDLSPQVVTVMRASTCVDVEPGNFSRTHARVAWNNLQHMGIGPQGPLWGDQQLTC